MKIRKLLTLFAITTVVFWTGCKKDTFVEDIGLCPLVLSTIPSDGAVNVPINQIVRVVFNKEINPSTINTSSITLNGPTSQVAGVVTYGGDTATFTPSALLAMNTTYTGAVKTTVADVKGNFLQKEYVWTFTTGSTIAPQVISTDPANLDTNVVLNKIITATFSVVMDSTTITGASFTISESGNPVAGTVTHTGNVATFTPSVNLLSGTTYTGTITTAARNMAGTGLANNYVWTFTTETVTAPRVISTNPTNLASNVPLNQIISATFSEPMNPSTLTGTSFTITESGNPVLGTVSYSGNTAFFTPSANLVLGTTYTGTITVAAENPAGTPLVNNYVWTFTTLPPVPPTVISTDPSNLEAGVALNRIVTVLFSEPMDPLTINGTSITLRENGNLVSGVVTYSGSTATFTPSTNLLSGTTYTGTVTTAAQNAVGTPLASNYVWTFSTVAPLGPAGVDLDCVAGYAIIGGSTVTNTGPTIVDGDLGLSPGTAVIGFPPGTIINGSSNINNASANNGKLCLTAAYIDAAGRSLNVVVMANGELGGLTLAPGLYRAPGGSFDITSVDLTLDAQGDVNAVWIFQMPSSTLTVGNGVSVILAGGASPANIYWQVGTSATLGTTSDMKGTIMADQSITLETGAVLLGRALTRIGAITLDDNAVTKP